MNPLRMSAISMYRIEQMCVHISQHTESLSIKIEKEEIFEVLGRI